MNSNHSSPPSTPRPVLLRREAVCTMLGMGKTKIHDDVRRGLLPPPVKISSRYARWPDSEIGAIVTARISGASDLDVKKLVSLLVVTRQKGRLDA